MATQFDQISEAHKRFIEAQHVFFVGTAADTGRVNVSPKGMDSLRVLGPDRIIWRNLTGSGNETAGHLRAVNRMTLMWCSFEAQPMILRSYGTARTLQVEDAAFGDLNALFFATEGARQIYDMQVEMVQSSCGYAVPFMEYAGPRDVLKDWSARKGHDGIRAYWRTRNTETIDGFATGIPTDAQRSET